MTESEAGPQVRALELLSAEGPDAILAEPWALAALADPGQWAGDVERALNDLPGKKAASIRRAGRKILRAGREEAGEVVRFPGSPPPAQEANAALYDPRILVCRGSTWVRRDGRYTLAPDSAVVTEVLRQGVPIVIPTPTGYRAPTFAEAYDRLGCLVKNVVYVLGQTTDRYDNETSTLFLGCGTPDPRLVSQAHPDVQLWLSALMGGPEQLARLIDWIKSAWCLDKPTAALYLEGGGGTGKSMFAQALQRCFSEITTTYADVVLGTYSAGIVNQPIVWLDERAPEDRNGKGTAAFRSLIGNRSHPYTAKYQASGTILGCPRLVITSNTDDALRFGREDLVRADLEAIAVRILHFDVCPEAAELLKTLDTSEWVTMQDGSPGRICQHFAAIRDHHTIKAPGKRLLVEGEVGAWLRRQSTQSGMAQDVLVAIVRRLTDLKDATDPITGRDFDRIATPERGCVLVSATALHSAWPVLSGDRSGRVTVARLGRVLRSLSGHAAAHNGARQHRLANDLLRDACRSIHGTDGMLAGVLW